MYVPGASCAGEGSALGDRGARAVPSAPFRAHAMSSTRGIGGHKTKREAVTVALQEYIARRKQLGILDLFGTVDYDPDHDYKAERQRKRR